MAKFALCAQATTNLTVNTLADDPDGPTPGYTTLRDAINEADADTANSYVITFSVTGTIDLASSLPDLNNNIDLDGPGVSALTVQRDASAVPFSIFTVDSGATVSLSGMTIAGGSAPISGGGIYNLGTLTVISSTFSNNSANIGFGGGVDSFGGTLTVIDSTFTDNSSLAGGGLSAERVATATVIGSTFANNSGFDYGGVANIDESTMTVIDSTFTDNSASLYGGGFGNESVATVTGNTFTNNSAEYGGGIASAFGAGDLTLNNTIVAGNTSTEKSDNDIFGQVQPTSAFQSHRRRLGNLRPHRPRGAGTEQSNRHDIRPAQPVAWAAGRLWRAHADHGPATRQSRYRRR